MDTGEDPDRVMVLDRHNKLRVDTPLEAILSHVRLYPAVSKVPLVRVNTRVSKLRASPSVTVPLGALIVKAPNGLPDVISVAVAEIVIVPV